MEISDRYDPIPEYYSPALRQFISDCLSFHPENRPNVFDLFQRAQSHVPSVRRKPLSAEPLRSRYVVEIVLGIYDAVRRVLENVLAVIFAGWMMSYPLLFPLLFPLLYLCIGIIIDKYLASIE